MYDTDWKWGSTPIYEQTSQTVYSVAGFYEICNPHLRIICYENNKKKVTIFSAIYVRKEGYLL